MLDAGLVEALNEVGTQGVHGDAVVGDQHVHTVAGGGDGDHVLADRGHAAADQRGDDDAALGAGRRVRVAAGGAAEHAVGAGEDVDVEAGVDLQGGQHHEVQLVDEGALVGGVGVLGGGHLKVVGGLVDGVDGVQVEVLHVDDLADLALLEHLHHRAADAADGPAHLDAALVHVLFQEEVGRERRAAHAGLEGEALLEVRGGGDDLGHVLGHHQVAGVLADAGRGGGDLLGVADGVDHHDRVHVDGLNGGTTTWSAYLASVMA